MIVIAYNKNRHCLNSFFKKKVKNIDLLHIKYYYSDYRGMSGDGYWSSAPDDRTAPLCAAANPTADYRWEARSCGGPTVASFICELPG